MAPMFSSDCPCECNNPILTDGSGIVVFGFNLLLCLNDRISYAMNLIFILYVEYFFGLNFCFY